MNDWHLKLVALKIKGAEELAAVPCLLTTTAPASRDVNKICSCVRRKITGQAIVNSIVLDFLSVNDTNI